MRPGAMLPPIIESLKKKKKKFIAAADWTWVKAEMYTLFQYRTSYVFILQHEFSSILVLWWMTGAINMPTMYWEELLF